MPSRCRNPHLHGADRAHADRADGDEVKASTLGPNFAIDSTGQTTVQKSIQSQLDQILSLLNTQAGDRYLFSGKASDTPAVDTTDHILNGNGAHAGLKQMITERNQADLGVSGLGRLVIPSTVASLVGSGAAVLPDAPATGTGSVAVAGATTLASLGVTVGDTITIDDGTSQTNYVVQPGDTINSLVANLTSPPGAANVTVSVQAGRLQIQSNDTTSTITVSDSSGTGADIAAIGFGAGNTSFAPTNLLTQGLSGQSLIVTIGANPPLTVGFGSLPGQVATLAGLNAMLGTLVGGTASVNPANGNLTVTAASTNDGITIAGTVNPAVFGLATTTAAPGAIISEDVAGSPFGFKLGNVLCSLTGATVTWPSGSPAGISVAFGATPPNNGESIRFTFNLPDGSTEQITLQATTASPPGANQFTIGATPAATQANLQAALTTSVDKLAHTALSAASAMAAANDFFATDSVNPPLRVAGPPFNTATALVAGTPANTVSWYTGEDGPTPTRATAVARIDPTISVAYGLRANEQGIRWLVQNVAVLAATTYQQSDPNAPVSYAALNQRVGAALAVPTGTQKIDDIEFEPRQRPDRHGAGDRSPCPDPKDPDRHAAADRRHLPGAGGIADPLPADDAAGVAADHREFVENQPGELSVDSQTQLAAPS